MRVIIVEDEKRASRGLRNLLQTISEDVQVVAEASDGLQAFERIRSLRPDVVFTDIRMQFMDGIGLIKAVRENRIDTRFVIISAYEEFSYARQAIQLGVVDYLVKPITQEEVSHVLEKLKMEGKQNVSLDFGNHSLKENYPDAHPLIQKALDILECSYATKISQKELAEQLGITAEYFSYLFSREVQESFSRFLRRYRIDKARELLEDNEMTAEQVSHAVGFSELKYFYKCFKDETGVSLGEYRKGKR